MGGGVTSSAMLQEKHGLRVFEIWVHGEVFEAKGNQITGN